MKTWTRSLSFVLLGATGLTTAGCRLLGNIECESSNDCPSGTPVCRDGACEVGKPDEPGADGGIADVGPLDGGATDGGDIDDGGSDTDSGTDAGAVDAGADAGVLEPVPIEPPGQAIQLEGALSVTDPTMENAPFETCNQAIGVPRGLFRYDAYAFVNDTGAPQVLDVIAVWSDGTDGQLLLYRPAFNPQDPAANCAFGDDDDGTRASSRMPFEEIAPGEVVTIVATTRFEDELIPTYLLAVETRGRGNDAGPVDAGETDAGAGNDDAGIEDAGLADAGPDDAGPDDAGADDAGAADAGPADAGFDAGIEGPSVLITEVMDHSTNVDLRYVELSNVGNAEQDLTGWSLRLYANGSTTSLAAANLSGVLGPRNRTEFETAFAFAPQLESATAINGSGNDVYELRNGPSVVDIYGQVGVNGTGQPWEYTDRVVKRDLDVFFGATIWVASEWTKSTDMAVAKPGARD